MSLRIRRLKLLVVTEKGDFGADIKFPDGLVLLRADNTSGKSTCLKAMIYALGLERMFGPANQPPLFVAKSHGAGISRHLDNFQHDCCACNYPKSDSHGKFCRFKFVQRRVFGWAGGGNDWCDHICRRRRSRNQRGYRSRSDGRSRSGGIIGDIFDGRRREFVARFVGADQQPSAPAGTRQ
jgi:hypothetical protein